MNRLAIRSELVAGDRYALTHMIEHNDFVLTALAHDLQTNTTVFIKAKSAEPKNRLRLEREADVLASLNHPQIPQLLDAELDREVPYIVTEHKSGTRYIERWFQKYSLPYLAGKICLSALEALRYTHEKDLVHRDVKTRNLVMQWSGEVSLTDFELAFCKDEETAQAVYANASCKDPMITDANQVQATAAYVSPERARAERATPRSDLYSLGVVLYELLYGQVPFQGETSADVARQHVREQINFLDMKGRNVPVVLAAISARATQKDPKDRYESAEEMAEDLTHYLINSSRLNANT